jgi:WD40 repeat protein
MRRVANVYGLWMAVSLHLAFSGCIPTEEPKTVPSYKEEGSPKTKPASVKTTAGPSKVNANQLLTLAGHTSMVTSATYSPDGSQIVTASVDGAKVWDAKSATLLFTLTKDWVRYASYSPDGAQIITVGSGDAKLWEAKSGKLLVSCKEGSGDDIASYSPDGTQIVTVSKNRGNPNAMNSKSGALLFRLEKYGIGSSSVHHSKDGAQIITTGMMSTEVWDSKSGAKLFVLSPGSQNSSAYSPDGTRIVTSGNDGLANVWDTKSGKLLLSLKHTSWLGNKVETITAPSISMEADRDSTKLWTNASYSPDGTQILTASPENAKVWDAKSGKLLLTLGEGAVCCASYSPDGTQIVTAGQQPPQGIAPGMGAAKVWDAKIGSLLFTSPEEHKGQITSLSYSPDGTQILTSSNDTTAKIWTLP